MRIHRHTSKMHGRLAQEVRFAAVTCAKPRSFVDCRNHLHDDQSPSPSRFNRCSISHNLSLVQNAGRNKTEHFVVTLKAVSPAGLQWRPLFTPATSHGICQEIDIASRVELPAGWSFRHRFVSPAVGRAGDSAECCVDRGRRFGRDGPGLLRQPVSSHAKPGSAGGRGYAVFTSAYAACPVCSPTRAALLTGKYPARLHLTDWLPGPARSTGASPLLRPNFRSGAAARRSHDRRGFARCRLRDRIARQMAFG